MDSTADLLPTLVSSWLLQNIIPPAFLRKTFTFIKPIHTGTLIRKSFVRIPSWLTLPFWKSDAADTTSRSRPIIYHLFNATNPGDMPNVLPLITSKRKIEIQLDITSYYRRPGVSSPIIYAAINRQYEAFCIILTGDIFAAGASPCRVKFACESPSRRGMCTATVYLNERKVANTSRRRTMGRLLKYFMGTVKSSGFIERRALVPQGLE